MIKPLRTSYLLPAELAATIRSYLDLMVKGNVTNPFIALLITKLTEDLIVLNEAITAVRANKLVDDLAAADAVQDDLYIAFKDFVDLQKRRKTAGIPEAYDTVWPIIEQIGTTIYNLGYVEQSGRMKALFEQLDKAAPQAALTTMGASALYAELKAAHEAFKNLFAERIELDAGKNYPTLQQAKKQAVPHVNAFLSALNVLHEAEDAEVLGIASEVNTITDQVMTTARARRNRGDGGEGEE